MPNADENHQISQWIRQRLQEHEFRLQDPHRAFKVYREFLTDEERRSLGPFENAYSNSTDRTIGMWMRVKGVGRNRAIIELARLSGLPDGDYFSLLRDIGESITPVVQIPSRPVWQKDRHELLLDGEVIRRIERPGRAVNLILILDVFQEVGWQMRIDDPLPPSRSSVGSRRRSEVVGSLNYKLQRIRFFCDYTGAGFRWAHVIPSE